MSEGRRQVLGGGSEGLRNVPAERRLELYEIIPAIPHRLLEVSQRRNPVRPTFRNHFDPAIIEPLKNVNLVCHAVVVRRVQVAESVV